MNTAHILVPLDLPEKKKKKDKSAKFLENRSFSIFLIRFDIENYFNAITHLSESVFTKDIIDLNLAIF